MKKLIILLVSLLIDGIVTNITLYSFNNITYLTPMCTIVSLIFLYDDKNFIKLYLSSSIIYGALYMNNLLFTLILFFIVIIFIKILNKINNNVLTILIKIILVIMLFDGISFILNSLVNNTYILKNYVYKIEHSIIFNVIYGLILYKNTKKSSKFNY